MEKNQIDEKEIKQITDDDLNTKTDLKTENYEFEILGLKDPNDLRKFSRSFIKADGLFAQLFAKIFVPNGEEGKFLKWLKGVPAWASITWNEITGKPSTFTPTAHKHQKSDITDFPTSLKNPNALTISLNGTSQGGYDGSAAKSINITPAGIGAAVVSHNHDDRYYTETEIDEKLKNFCPFPINSLYLSLSSENPTTTWLGTTWEKIESRFLLGSSSSYTLRSTGGSSTVKLTKANLPTEKLSVDSFSLSRGTQEITGTIKGEPALFHYQTGVFTSQVGSIARGGDTGGYYKNLYFQASKGWTGVSTSASPITENMGSGTSFNIMPPYISVNIWKRTS